MGLERRIFLTTCVKVATAFGVSYLFDVPMYAAGSPTDVGAVSDWLKLNKALVQAAAAKSGISTNPTARQNIAANQMPAVMLEDSDRYIGFQKTLIEQATAAKAPSGVVQGLTDWNKLTSEGRATRAQKKYSFDVSEKLLKRVDTAGLELELDRAIQHAPDVTNRNALSNMKTSLANERSRSPGLCCILCCLFACLLCGPGCEVCCGIACTICSFLCGEGTG
jgi:hypothetical protein